MTAEQFREERAARRQHQLAVAGLNYPVLERMTFARFARELQPDAYYHARLFVDQWPDLPVLVLDGDYGTGKTHVAVAILHELMAMELTVRYCHLPDLAARLKVADNYAATIANAVEPLRTADTVVLDDVGRETPTPSLPERIDVIVNERWMRHAPTIITTNLGRDGLAKWFSGAAASRMLGSATFVTTRPGDRRLVPVVVDEPRRLVVPTEECPTCKDAGWVIDTTKRVGGTERAMKCPTCTGRR